MTLVFLVTAVFLALFPFFKKRADSEFENPVIGSYFISTLYESNYVQYKYLRERADQKAYSFADLYVDVEYMGTTSSNSTRFNNQSSVVYTLDEAISGRGVPEEYLQEIKTNYTGQVDEARTPSSELTQMLDYYAVDTVTGVSIGNSSRSELKDILNGIAPEENPYVYYVYMNYDGAGNVANCGVSAAGKVNDFLKRVEALGKEKYLADSFDEDRKAIVTFCDEENEEWYHYQFQFKNPANMKIIYAMTADQYQSFLNGYNSHSYYDMPSYTYTSQNSYYAAGVPGVFFCFLLLAMALGAGTVWLLGNREDGTYVYHKLYVCNLPLEVTAFVFICGIGFATNMVDLICSYQKGWFLADFREQILEPVHMQWLVFLIVTALFFLYFMAAFTLGSVIPRLVHFRSYFKEYSILYQYWDMVVTWIKNFYHELVNFDVGSDAKRIIAKLVIVNFIVLAVISMFWLWGIFPLILYSIIVYFLLKKYVKDVQNKYQNLLKATSAIASGDLDIALSEDFGVFESYKNELRQIQVDFKRAVEEEVKSQRMKSELITNVSHDLKTPLTAIITYINLLKEPGLTEEQRQEYIATLDKKAVRLKVLIEDLFEVSKATTNNITLNYDKVDIGNLLRQCYLEYEDRIEEAQLNFKFILPEEKVILTLDPQKTFRIFENLYTNIIKYALPCTRVYVILKDKGNEAVIEVKNISKSELQVAPEELTERFVRGDDSRNTEGSGLGLAIARSFTELQHGSLHISVDGDLFKVTLRFRKWNGSNEAEDRQEQAVSEHIASEHEAQSSARNGRKSYSAVSNRAVRPMDTPPYTPRRWRTEKNLQKNERKRKG